MRKEPFYGRKDRLCYVELDFDRTDIIKNICQSVTNIFMTFFHEKYLRLWKKCEKSLPVLSCEKKYSYVQTG